MKEKTCNILEVFAAIWICLAFVAFLFSAMVLGVLAHFDVHFTPMGSGISFWLTSVIWLPLALLIMGGTWAAAARTGNWKFLLGSIVPVLQLVWVVLGFVYFASVDAFYIDP